MLERVDMKSELNYSALPMAVDPVILSEDISLSPCVYSISEPTNDLYKVPIGIATRK
jgi:hypothetical protein